MSTYFRDKKILITAGPTYEKLDPVRFIGNFSSGKMGIAIAEAAHKLGADVHLVLGPTHIRPENEAINITPVMSAADMFEAVKSAHQEQDIIIMAAAVADYTPEAFSDKKIKKSDDDMVIHLKRTTDILKYLGANKPKKQALVGFALETNNALENALGKLKRKNADILVLNSLQDKGAGFRTDTNKVTILDKNNKITRFELKPKTAVAEDILHYIEQYESH